MIATTTFAQSEEEGFREELSLENETEVAIDVADTPLVSSTELTEDSKKKKASFRDAFKELKRDLKENLKATKKISKEKKKTSNGLSSSVPLVLLIILAILLPWLAVGLYTDWDLMYTLLALLLWFLGILPGIIFAFLVIFDVV